MCRVLSAIAISLASVAAVAEIYPSKPIRCIVPFPPGGIVDVVARQVGGRLANELGVSVIVDNRSGAAGNIGVNLAAKAPADGYTIVMGNIAPNAINVSLFSPLPYDAVGDFQPISLVGTASLILVVHPSIPIASVGELITYAKLNPGKLSFGSSGNGSASHIALAMLNSMARISNVHVPYRGGPLAQLDLVGGRLQGFFDTQVLAMPQIKAGKIRPLGVTSRQRSPALPNVPPIADTIPGYEFTIWMGILAPAGLATERTEKLNQATRKALNDSSLREYFITQGLQPSPTTPKGFGDFIVKEIEKFSKIVRETGMSAD